MHPIAQQLDSLPAFLSSLKEAAGRYLKYPSNVSKNGVLNVGHRPWVAPMNYMLMLYPGVAGESLERYSDRFELQVPEPYADFLRAVNGGFFFGMSLSGIPGSMLGNPPLLDRSQLQCHDLSMCARSWILEYNVPPGFFHFGGRKYSYSQNVGYFFDGDRRIVSIRGRKKVIGEWGSFSDFLRDELAESEKLEEELRPSKWDG